MNVHVKLGSMGKGRPTVDTNNMGNKFYQGHIEPPK